jgi:CRP-like cAMP-binding protein
MDLFILSNHYSLLKPIPIELLKEVINTKAMKIKTYSKNEIIHFEEDICSNIEILLLGTVVVERIDASGNLLTITEFYPDDLLGGNLIFSTNPYYPMTVTAKSETTLLEIQKDFLFELCSDNKDFLKVFLKYISDHALLLGDKIKHYVNRSIRENLIAYLSNAYKLQNSNKIILDSTKKELSERMGVQRTSLSRELQKMKNEGLILFDAESITILKIQLLE